MASGIVHDKFHRFMILPTSVGVWAISDLLLNKNLQYSIKIAVVFYVAQQFNRLCTPDSDDNKKTFQDFLTSVLDPYFSVFWYVVFYPYGILIPHRSFVSHSPIFGALFRLIYLCVIFSPIIAIFSLHKLLPFYLDYVFVFVLGYILADIYHILLDYTPLRWAAEVLFAD